VTESATRNTNRLASETSPYLLQHAHNPVDWYPWGPEALARARELDRPIFLSIGYAACHWCHVMERESFEDEATAADLNAAFVAIKVDREERPDLDAVYMDAVQQMTGQGGWPMSVFLTPDGRPFFGGTYFPDQPRHGLPSFRQVLAGVREAWLLRRSDVEQSAARLTDAISHEQASPPIRIETSAEGLPRTADGALRGAVAVLASSFDARRGGWEGAPKFPQPMAVELLLREHLRTGDDTALAMARRTLDAMADGGIRDHVGGGFARYATDAAWLVPHFEKMLYDNAQLARVYVHASKVTGDPGYAEVARDTLDFAVREMRVPADGAFAASLDADTDGEEGGTYVWELPEVEAVLGSEAQLFSAAYGVTANGNWEGRTILSRVQRDEQLADQFSLAPEKVRQRLIAARQRLLEVRNRRAQPRRDDKVLASWNGLMIGALAAGGDEYARIATEAAEFVWANLRGADGRLRRSWKDDRIGPPAVLEDHTHLADGFLALYEATFDERWFAAARELMDTVLEHFADPSGGLWDTADDAEALVARPRGLQDNALPSGGGMAATVLVRLAALTGEGRYRDASERLIGAILSVAQRYPAAFPQWLLAAQLAIKPLDEIAIVGGSEEDRDALLRVTQTGLRPWQVIAATPDSSATTVPLLADRPPIDGRATAYVCHGFACDRPVTDPEALARKLSTAA
jgi:uncharacterized protein YyaL (SSP411 family)